MAKKIVRDDIQEINRDFTRDPSEVARAYKDNEIVKYHWDEMYANPRALQYPFGYTQADDPKKLKPIPFELDVLEHAKKLLDLREISPANARFYSLRKVASWVSSVTGRKISHQGLKKRINDDYARHSEIEKDLKKALEEAIREKKRYIRTKVGIN